MAGILATTRRLLSGLAPTRFGSDYDATEDKKRRRPPKVQLLSEDKHLDSTGRKKLVATARNIHRNYEIAAWMIRKHLDYVSSFEFQAKQNGQAIDDQLERLMTRWSKAANFAAAGRHSRRRFTRLAEARRTIDGDFFTLKLARGQVQGIEGDRVRTPLMGVVPDHVRPEDLVHGIQVDKAGRAVAYALHNRNTVGDGFTFDRLLPARHVVPLAYYDRLDQVRGISPLASAINRMQDTYEALDYALIKAKVTQLFALAIFSERDDTAGEVVASDGSQDADGDGTADEGTERYSVDFGRGPIKLELDPGDDAKFLESAHPSTQFKDYSELCIAVALRSLDIPYTFFDCTKANYSATRQDLLLYDQSAREKREDIKEWLDALTAWRIGLWVLDGDLVLPPGLTVADLSWEWIHKGIPWIDPLKEVKADGEAVSKGFTSTVRVCKQHGTDAYELVDEEADYQAYRRKKLGPAVSPPAGTPAGSIPGGENAQTTP